MEERRKDNLSKITEECNEFFGRYYMFQGNIYKFTGIIVGWDDYYYGMVSEVDNTLHQFSCVGSLETWEFKLAPNYCPYCKQDHVCREMKYAARFGHDLRLVDGLLMQQCSDCGARFVTPHQHELQVRAVHESRAKDNTDEVKDDK